MAAASLNVLGTYFGTIVGTLVVGADGTIYGAASQVAGGNGSTIFSFSGGTFTDLGAFDYATTGSAPAGGVGMGPGGMLYATTFYGGANDVGTVDSVSTTTPLTTVAALTASTQMPEGPPVVDAAGDVFFAGGGNGIYEVAAGTHTVTLLASVTAYGSLAIDSAGNLYAYASGGAHGYGSVVEISQAGVVTTLLDFNPSTGDGGVPEGGLVMDSAGNLYGNAHNLFEIAAGTHAYTQLATFADGGISETNQIAVTADGTIYGTTTDANGAVYELAAGSGTVTTILSDSEQTLHGLTVAPDGDIFGTANGGEIVQLVLCFLAGTAIATPAGETPIEALGRGDLIITADGGTRPIRWIGIHTVSRRFADPLRTLPIRIAAGALGHALPHRDLLVSPDHAMFLDGVLVQANALVDGAGIRRETAMPETFRYYHIELDGHSLILAEGAPTETFVDNADRMAFDNWEEHRALFPEEPPIPEMPYPRIKARRQMPAALLARLAGISAAA